MVTTGFREDLLFFEDLLKDKTPFSVTRFGDGEMTILEGKPINVMNKNEFSYEGQADLREDLIHSFTYNAPNYYVGIACRCCVGDLNFKRMEISTGLPDDKLTWANIFVNSNFEYFKSNIVPLFNEYDHITLVSPGVVDKLPFRVDTHYLVGPNAWIHDKDVLEKIEDQIHTKQLKNQLFLFCAGPYANILCYKLYKQFPENTFLDLGSVFNVELEIGSNRGYLNHGPTLNKTCIW